MFGMSSITLPLIFSVVTTVVSAIFAGLVLVRWRAAHSRGRKAPHLLAWGIGLSLYALGAFSQIVLDFVWSPLFFSLWYWAGAIAVAPWLGQGTVYLLWRRGSIARNIQMALLLVCVMTLPWALFLTPLNAEAWRPGTDMTVLINDIMQRGGVRGFSPVMNVWGTLALVGGAIYSAVLFRRKQIMPNRMAGNWLIAAGGLLPALGGALIRLGVPELKYAGELLGVVLIFAGFLLATHLPEEVQSAHEQRAARRAGS
jgi:hypothetical protein